MFRLETGDWQQLGRDAGVVREAVFVQEQQIPIELEWDSRDALSEHCVAYAGDQPIGTGRLLPDGHIGRMAVLESHRGDRIGGRILERLIERGRELGHRSFELSAQQYVSAFYRRHGFVQIGEPYDEVGIAHVRMRLDDALPAQMRLVEREWLTQRPDGCALYQREWLPGQGEPLGCVYLFHGLGSHLGREVALARWLAGMGWQVRGHDLRGHGRSQGRRGALHAASDLYDDAVALLADFRNQTKHKPILMGRDLGGLLVTQLVALRQSECRAFVAIAPTLDSGMSRMARSQIRIMNVLAPDLAAASGIDPTLRTHDAAALLSWSNDSLVHDRVTGRLMTWAAEAGRQALAGAPGLVIPGLLMAAGDDRIVDAQACTRYVQVAGPGPVTLKWYEDAYHDLLDERPDIRTRVLDDLRGWLAALPKP